jgi:hypothetical protein
VRGGLRKNRRKNLEREIQEKLEDEGVKVKEIECPKSVKRKEGDKFECAGKSDRGDKFTVKVRQRDSEGEVKWELEGLIVDAKEFTETLRQKSNRPDVQCEPGKFIAVEGTTLPCTAVGQKLTVTFTSNEGAYKWE